MSCKLTKSPSRQIIHEGDTIGRHRLVILRNGIPTKSPWYEGREVGLYAGIYFHVGAGGSLPTVFRASAVAHENLG
jgi:hypothetical protein